LGGKGKKAPAKKAKKVSPAKKAAKGGCGCNSKKAPK